MGNEEKNAGQAGPVSGAGLSSGAVTGRPSVLVVDDEAAIRSLLMHILAKNGYDAAEAEDGTAGVEAFRRVQPSAVLMDLKMPGMNGLRALEAMRGIDDSVPVIILTSHGDIPTAVEATRLGAYDFITKPPDFDRLVVLIKRAVEAREMMMKVRMLGSEVVNSIVSCLGRSASTRAVAAQIHQVARSDFSLVIQGETGTGKSFIARMIHDLSVRARGPFVMVDVGAIPDSLMESELFGFERGAFTGAERRKPGYFEIAAGGTLFIDELQNMSPAMQGKLLTAVEERWIRPLGSVQQVNVDIRLICATNADIRALVRDGKVREDLYFRLGEFIISLPPLRECAEDIRHLAQRFLEEAAEDLKRPPCTLSEEAMERLLVHDWPGNIRELKNVIRRAALTATGVVIRPKHLQFHSHGLAAEDEKRCDAAPLPSVRSFNLEEVEKQAIISAMAASGGNKTKASSLLDVDYKTLLRKLKRYGI